MAGKTYTTKGIVLRKTKLGESDLIIAMLADDGSQIRAVAKGARKPQSLFSSRLELYSIVEVLNACGKNLDIVKEAQLIEPNKALRVDIEHSSAAACLAELIERVSQPDLAVSRFFEFGRCALDALKRSHIDQIQLITAACLLKVFAFVGLRPCFDTCIICGREIPLNNDIASLNFSFEDGGVICETCAQSAQTILIQTSTLSLAYDLLNATFDQVPGMHVLPQTGFDILRFCQRWTQVHVGSTLKSLRFLLTSDLF